jgi:hypothetical protein
MTEARQTPRECGVVFLNGHLEKLISVPNADPSGVNVYESEREQSRII